MCTGLFLDKGDDIMVEEWKPIKGYEGYYEISSFGRIKSIERKVYNPGVIGEGSYRTVPEKIRKPNIMKGYHCICLIKNKSHKVFRVHRLVMEHFVSEAPSQEHQVNHIDGDKSNNHVENLEWVTPKENTQHAIANGLRHKPSDETKKKMGLATKKRWQDPKYQKFQQEMAKKLWSDEEIHRQRALAIKEGIARAKERRMCNG